MRHRTCDTRGGGGREAGEPMRLQIAVENFRPPRRLRFYSEFSSFQSLVRDMHESPNIPIDSLGTSRPVACFFLVLALELGSELGTSALCLKPPQIIYLPVYYKPTKSVPPGGGVTLLNR